MDFEKKVDMIIISYKSVDLTVNCINSAIETAGYLIDKTIVVDNASNDGTVESLEKQFDSIKLIKNSTNLGYAAAVNIGVRESDKEFVIISNNDVLFQRNSILNLLEPLFYNSNIGVAGPQQIYPDGSWQNSFGDLPNFKLALKKLFLINHLQEKIRNYSFLHGYGKNCPRNVQYVDGAVMAIRTEAFEIVGGFDEDYFFFTEEADFCYKLTRKNWKITHIPDSQVIHVRGAAFDDKELNEDRLSSLVNSKALFCSKRLGFQQAKFYIISEIVYSFNMRTLWLLAGFLFPDKLKEKAEIKTKTFTIFFKLWIKEFNNFLKENEQ